MRAWRSYPRNTALTSWLALFVCCGVGVLAWFGYQAANEWRRSSIGLVERRTREISDLLALALTRDMRAAQVSVLDGRDWDRASLAPPYSVNDTIAAAFARYPYPEAFFAWADTDDPPVFFARSDRRPPWLPANGRQDTYPVEVEKGPPAARDLFERIARDSRARAQYSTFELTIADRRYQAVARILYTDGTRERMAGVLGFVVDLDWVRRHYFSTITEQVTRIAQAGDGVTSAIVDEHDQLIVGSAMPQRMQSGEREFLELFFDPMIVASGPPHDLIVRRWRIAVSPGPDPTLAIAAEGARHTLIVIAVAVLAVGFGLILAVSAGKAAAETAAMRADFVSTITHGLKTPVSVIRGIGETLLRGRVTTSERLHDYAQMLMQESHRLTRLIENSLAYAKVTDAADVYVFEKVDAVDLVDEALRGCQRLLAEAGIDIELDVPASLPPIAADRTSLILALDNLVDNAMRYAGPSKTITVRVRSRSSTVEIEVIDRGPGMPAGDLAHVRGRFARGRATSGHGSGLGLAIVNRIATHHGGSFRLESVIGTGTTATLIIPMAAVAHQP